MANIQYQFSDPGGDYEKSSLKSWIIIFSIVTIITIGIIILFRVSATPTTNQEDTQAVSSTQTPTQNNNTKTEEPPPPQEPPKPTITEPEPPPEPPKPIVNEPPISAKAQNAFETAKTAIANDDLALARQKLLDALKENQNPTFAKEIEKELGAVNISLLFSQRIMPGKIEYTIASGDTLQKIASKYNTPVLLIQAANGITNPRNLKIGTRLRLLDNRTFTIEVSKSKNELLVKLDGVFFKRYRVGTGQYSKTPVGTFKIVDKVSEPTWWRPDGTSVPYGSKENVLGTRWMAIEATGNTPTIRGYGIHGTWEDNSIGKQSSAGCVRMLNKEVEELFTYIPRNTTVTITE